MKAKYGKRALLFTSLIIAALLLFALAVPVLAATFGITSTGSTSYPTGNLGTTTVLGSTAEAQTTLSAQKITVPTGGATIKSVTIYWGAVSRAGSVRFAFYTDSGGNPNTLVAGSDTGIIAVPTSLAGTWQTISYSTPFYLSAGTYWLARQTTDPVDGKGPKRNYALTGGPGRKSRVFAWGAFPDPFGTPTTSDTLNESEYTTYVRIEGYAKATKVTLSDDNASISSVSFYSHAAGNVRLAIYSNSGSAPSTKQWESNSTAVTASGLPKWTTVNISAGTPSSLTLSSGTYWLAWQWDSASSGPSYTAGSAGDGNYMPLAYGAYPASWTGGTSTSEKWSIYASYTVPATIEITATANISGWALSPLGTQPQTTTGTLNVTCSGNWEVTVEDAEAATSGKMTDWSGSAYNSTTKLANFMKVAADSEVTLPAGGTIATGSGDDSVTVYFKQEVSWSDQVLPEGHSYRIIVTFTGTAISP
jgi:hypothetical protein